MRNDVYERMKHFVIEDIKPNYTAIARQYGVDPRTVKAAYLRSLTSLDNNNVAVLPTLNFVELFNSENGNDKWKKIALYRQRAVHHNCFANYRNIPH